MKRILKVRSLQLRTSQHGYEMRLLPLRLVNIRHFHTNYQKKLLTPTAEESALYKCYCQSVNDKLPADAEKLDAEIKIVKSVPDYRKHVLLVSSIDEGLNDHVPVWRDVWESQLAQNKQFPYDIIPKLAFGQGILFNAISVVSSKEEIPKSQPGVYDFIVFPDMKLYRIRESDINNFNTHINSGEVQSVPKLTFNDYLTGKAQNLTQPEAQEQPKEYGGEFETMTLKNEKWVFICGHRKRDKRCGLIAPKLVKELQKSTENRNLAIISHIGGHKYAGNVIIYRPHTIGTEMKHIDSLWFGKVTPDNIISIVNELNSGRIIENNFRGGLSL